uniref:Cytochrome c oxidase subunit 2 n=1 Tax=Chrysis ignita TaxID=212613 RepID=A0A1D9CJ23_9HYME|nr:cytochrome c oxidase subunit 2 [Chrysis terminata]AOY36267.1 cytochrome c oxidase subunit 2 [Chrysis terminata]
MATWMMFSIPDSSTDYLLMIDWFHDLVLMVLMFIMVIICMIFMNLMLNKMININLIHGHLIEVIWTVFPMIILLFLAVPSLQILYFIDEVYEPSLTIKINGHQWYWTYEYSDFLDLQFDSYMKTEMELSQFRLLDVDNNMVVPVKENIRLLISSDDVIHSWTIPCIGVKIDAVPGRFNQVMILMKRIGLFYGQCSEICGVNHSFMPIVLESTSLKNFLSWIK